MRIENYRQAVFILNSQFSIKMSETFEMVAKTLYGLEEILAEELLALGANDLQIGRRMVSFTGDKELLYKANFHCRTALRILKPIYHFKAKDADTVYKRGEKGRVGEVFVAGQDVRDRLGDLFRGFQSLEVCRLPYEKTLSWIIHREVQEASVRSCQ